MAFKTAAEYNEERFAGLFTLRNDGDSADVIFMYPDVSKVLIADTHYIRSADYTGYVHCCGRGCPACGKQIRVQTKLFIPLYIVNEEKLVFWDRNVRFENQLNHDVFEKFPDPTQYVFRITRHGAAGDINTTYEIVAVGRNTYKTYDQILKEKNATMPAYYENICRDVPAGMLSSMLASSGSSNNDNISYADMPNYSVTPRAVANSQPPVAPIPEAPSVEIPGDAEGDAFPELDADDGVNF